MLEGSNIFYPEYNVELFKKDMLVAINESTGDIVSCIRVFEREKGFKELRSFVTKEKYRKNYSASHLIYFAIESNKSNKISLICDERMLNFYFNLGFEQIKDEDIEIESLKKELKRKRKLFPNYGASLIRFISNKKLNTFFEGLK